MNNVRAIQKINEAELQSGTKKSWHEIYSHSAYVFIAWSIVEMDREGFVEVIEVDPSLCLSAVRKLSSRTSGLNYDLTEGDILAVFSQYGEIVNINLVKDKKTGKSKGFCFLCYEDQRSTVLAVDNFNGIKLCGRTIRVDHVNQYRRPKDESGNEIIEKGCAPKTPTPSPTPSPVRSPEPVEDKPKKVKKLSKDKKKKKRKIKLKYRDSDSDGQDSRHLTFGGAEWSRHEDNQESLHTKERKSKGGTRSRDHSRGHHHHGLPSPSPPPKHKFKASASERSRWHSQGEPGPSTSRSRQSYRDSRSRSRSRSRDRSKRKRRQYHSSEHTKARSRSRSRDRSEHHGSNKTMFDRTKHTHR